LRRLGHLYPPLLAKVATGAVESRVQDFGAFDLALLLCAFARASLRDEPRIDAVGRTLRERRSELMPGSVALVVHSLALLDSDGAGAAAVLAESVAPRCIVEASRIDLVTLAFALVILDLPAGELLSFVLERLARQRREILPQEMRALQIVGQCVQLPEALQPTMRKALESDSAAVERCKNSLDSIFHAIADVDEPTAVTTSKLQQKLQRFFHRLRLPHLAEGEVGPYVIDYVLPQRVAVEVDGFKHFYVFSRRLVAKSQLKLRVLRALGWRVASLPHYEWIPRREDQQLVYLADQIEQASGESLAAIRSSKDDTHCFVRQKRQRRWFPQLSAPPRGPSRSGARY